MVDETPNDTDKEIESGLGNPTPDAADHGIYSAGTPPVIAKMTKDLKNATTTLGRQEVRFLVDSYYQRQEARKRAGNQLRALAEAGEPNEVLQWLFDSEKDMEGYIKIALDVYSLSTPLGQWFRGICGIGPVIAAGFMAHIDVSNPNTTMGQKWSFAGLNPNMKWGKGEKRPFNASLKTLCWKMGESFVKTRNNPNSFYGPLYAERKEYETRKNANRDYADQAKNILETRNIKSKEMKASLEDGKLTKAHIDMRARRWTVKLAMGHYVAVAYWYEHGREMRVPYPIGVLHHDGYISPPNAPFPIS